MINGAECEPFLTCDYRLMLEEGCSLINGVRLLLKGSKASKAYICIEDNKPQAAQNLIRILSQAKADGLSLIHIYNAADLSAHFSQR